MWKKNHLKQCLHANKEIVYIPLVDYLITPYPISRLIDNIMMPRIASGLIYWTHCTSKIKVNRCIFLDWFLSFNIYLYIFKINYVPQFICSFFSAILMNAIPKINMVLMWHKRWTFNQKCIKAFKTENGFYSSGIFIFLHQ